MNKKFILELIDHDTFIEIIHYDEYQNITDIQITSNAFKAKVFDLSIEKQIILDKYQIAEYIQKHENTIVKIVELL